LLFYEGVDAGLTWLVVIAALNSVISLFYYFRVAKALFLTSPEERAPVSQPLLAGVLALLSAGTIVTGLYNAPLERWADQGPQSLGIPAEPDEAR
jgi:NADH-quinone oxidoreductase subunit N